MDNNIIKEKIKNLDLSFLKSINLETKELGNKVILFSSIIFFLSFNYLTISELEITGIKVLVEKDILLIILFFINTYYYLQFQNSLKIDSILAKVPSDVREVYNTLISNVKKDTSRINEIIEKHSTALESKKVNQDDIESLGKIIQESENNPNLILSKSLAELMSKGRKYQKRNLLLHQIFPSISFIICTISSFFILFYKYFPKFLTFLNEYFA